MKKQRTEARGGNGGDPDCNDTKAGGGHIYFVGNPDSFTETEGEEGANMKKNRNVVLNEEVKGPDIRAFVQGSSNEVVRHNAALLEHYLPTWMSNVRKNTEVINTLMAEGGHNVSEVPIEKDITTIFLIGSGPSLDEQLESLKRYGTKYLIIASNSNYSNLVANGIYPDIVLATDSSEEVAEQLWFIMEHNRKKTRLITTVTVDPQTIEAFYPNVYFFKSFFQDGEGGVRTPYNHFINNLFDNIDDFLTQAGCVTNQALILIDSLKRNKRLEGTEQIVCLGCDYSYTNDVYRCMRYKEVKEGVFEKLPPTSLEAEEEFAVDKRTLVRHQGVLTNPQMLRYKRSFYTVWTYLNLPLFRIGPSILDAVPEISWQTFLKGPKAVHRKANVGQIRKKVKRFFNLVLEKEEGKDVKKG